MKKKTLYITSKIFQYLFETSAISFFLFFFLEFFKEGLVTNYFNFNLLLIFVIGFGIISLLLPHYPTSPYEKKGNFLAILGGIFAGVVAFSILPNTLAVYKILPFISGIAFWAVVKVLNKSINPLS